MKNKSYNLFSFAGTGIAIGIPVTLICMALIGGPNEILAEFTVWTVASALYGILSGFMYCSDSDISLPAALALHCLGCMVITLAAAFICGYANSFSALAAAILPVFLIVYALVYALCLAAMKAQEKRINKELNKQ